jgi:hypothetical protein
MYSSVQRAFPLATPEHLEDAMLLVRNLTSNRWQTCCDDYHMQWQTETSPEQVTSTEYTDKMM